MSKPDDIPQDVWDAAHGLIDAQLHGHSAQHKTKHGLKVIAARAILAERGRQEAQTRDLVDCLSDMTEHYVELAGCGDCGFWDPEKELEVIAARKMIAAIRKGGD